MMSRLVSGPVKMMVLPSAPGKKPPPPARNDIAAAAPGARGAHPAFASARPVAVEEPPHAVPAPGQPDEDDEADDGGAPPEAPAKPDGVAL